jgi:2-aminoadipate transaminase
MRLNFSGVNDAEIREGINRIGRVIREQVELYESLAPSPGTPGREAEDVPADAGREAEDVPVERDNVVPLRKAEGA